MRTVLFGGASTLDNRFARADGATDWIRWSDEVAASVAGVWARVDTALMGRKTWEAGRRQGHWDHLPDGVAVYVFSRTLPPGPAGRATVVAADAAAFVADLKRREGRDICVIGGGELARALLEADLLDEIGFTLHPVLLGAGVPLFHDLSRQIDLELVSCRPHANGCVDLTYRVRR